ncbi:rhomboid family protein [Aliicoccus persicus]|uniref:Rhomboid protease GluP n=1 Tax=Aliicoccus persicus TaxID=930138 RepID=A0A662Z342_9STAP|nr:rhomboid family intramembrane serine protease [Aliicoccus persicus]SEV84711.1 rhomboid protease GluP [Aliicoccus persicus]
MNKWKIAYEVLRHSKYSYHAFDKSGDVIWLINNKDKLVMGISGALRETYNVTDQVSGRLTDFSRFIGFKPTEIKMIYPSPSEEKSKETIDGVKVVEHLTNQPEKILKSLFYRFNYKYKPDKEDKVYQKRVSSKHPLESYMLKFTPVTSVLLTLNLIVFLIASLSIYFNQSYFLVNILSVSHYEVVSGEIYRLLTSSFLHISIEHFLFNMFALYIIGKFVEVIYGKITLMITYILTGILSSMFSLMFISEGIMLGASGSIYGLLGLLVAHMIIHKHIDVKRVIQLAVIITVLSVFTHFSSNINHFAHFSGLIYGIIFGIFIYFRKVNLKIVFLVIVVFIVSVILNIVFISSHDSVPAFDTLAAEYIEQEQYEEALDIINEGLRHGNESYQTYASLAILAEVTGDYNKRDEFLQKSFELNPTNEQIAKEKIIMLRRDSEHDEIRTILSRFDIDNIEDKGLEIIAREYDE